MTKFIPASMQIIADSQLPEELIQCENCQHVGEVTYSQYAHSAICGWCGEDSTKNTSK